MHDLFVKYLSVSFGSFILCKIQEQLSLVVIGQWIVLKLRLKSIADLIGLLMIFFFAVIIIYFLWY